MPPLTCLCRTATTFGVDGGFDENAFRRFLRRFVNANLGVYLASAGSGEGHALQPDEIRRVYEVAVDECKGKIQVNANPPEKHTAKATIEECLRAAAARVDVINIYGPASWHGFRPTDHEYSAYYDDVLGAVDHPVAIAPNPVIGYTPKPSAIAEVCRRHHQIVAINLSGVGDAYFVELMEQLDRKVDVYVPLAGSPQMLDLGARGMVSMEGNILPKTFRRFLDLYAAKKTVELAQVYAELQRFIRYVRQWQSSTPRWLKMTMKVLKLPGGEGGLREPYRMPPESELQRFTDGLLRLRVPELDELAKAAGLALPT